MKREVSAWSLQLNLGFWGIPQYLLSVFKSLYKMSLLEFKSNNPDHQDLVTQYCLR